METVVSSWSNVVFSLLSSQLDILIHSEKTEAAVQVAVAAAKRFSQSVEMWTLSLQTLVRLESVEAEPLFQEALKLVNPKVTNNKQTHSIKYIFMLNSASKSSEVL